MMNGDGESGKDAVVDLPSDLESTTPGFVVPAAGATEEEEEAPASDVRDEGGLENPFDQTLVRDGLQRVDFMFPSACSYIFLWIDLLV